MPSGVLRSQLHVDQLLSNVAVKYKNERFIADQVFPMVPVKKTSDLYRTYTRQWSIPETNRAIGGLAREHQFDIGTESYSLEKHALKMFLADAAKENYDLASLEADATMELTEKILMRKEASCAALFTSTSWSLGASLGAGADAWDTTTGAPINIFDTGTSVVVSNSGVKPNFAILPIEVYNTVKNHTTIVDRVKYTSRELSPAIIGGLLGVTDLLVPDIYFDSGVYGASAAASAIGSIWKRNMAFLGYKAPAAGMMALSAGYCFQKAKPMVRKWREEEREADAIEVDVEYQYKVVASLAGYFINDAIA
jgi:hypothetical protein